MGKASRKKRNLSEQLTVAIKKERSFRQFLPALGLLLVTFLAYSSAMKGGFIWDDDSYVTNNLVLRSLRGLVDLWFQPDATPQYYPIVHTFLWVQYHFWEMNPFGYHLVNVIIHYLNGLLIFHILKNLQISGAFWVAAIFVLHPIQVESVAWITEIKNVLSLLFYLLSALFFIKFLPPTSDELSEKSPLYLYGLSLLFFVFALGSKTVAASLPVALFVVYWWKKERNLFIVFNKVVAFLVLGAVAGFFTAWVEKQYVGALGADFQFSLVERCLIAGRAWWFYLGKLIFPYPLIFTYPRWQIDASSAQQYVYPLMTLFALIGFWIFRRRIGRGPLAGLLFFTITLFPALGFYNFYPMRFSFVADHFQYVASLGPVILFVSGIHTLFIRKGISVRSQNIFWGLLVGVCSFLTWQQGKIYKDNFTLFKDVIAKNPSSWMAYNNRGGEYLSRQMVDQAFSDFEQTIKLKPDYAPVYANRAMVHWMRQNQDLAFNDVNKAISLSPSYQAGYGTRGYFYLANGKLDEALKDFNKALSLDHLYFYGYIWRGILYSMQEKYDLALEDFNNALELNSKVQDGYINKGMVYLRQKRYDLALNQFSQAIEVNPDSKLGFINRSYAFKAKGQFDLALRDALQAKALGFMVDEEYIRQLRQ
jgi:tetratricopeptide (TPR) repeat protein